MLSSSAISHVVVRASPLMIALNWSLSTSDGWPPCSYSKLSSPLQNFPNHYCTGRSLAVHGPGCWCCKLSPLLYNPFWTWIKKLLEFALSLWDDWMTSPTQRTWVWVNSGSWWWTGRPGVLQFMGSQRVRRDWTELKNKYKQQVMH